MNSACKVDTPIQLLRTSPAMGNPSVLCCRRPSFSIFNFPSLNVLTWRIFFELLPYTTLPSLYVLCIPSSVNYFILRKNVWVFFNWYKPKSGWGVSYSIDNSQFLIHELSIFWVLNYMNIYFQSYNYLVQGIYVYWKRTKRIKASLKIIPPWSSDVTMTFLNVGQTSINFFSLVKFDGCKRTFIRNFHGCLEFNLHTMQKHDQVLILMPHVLCIRV